MCSHNGITLVATQKQSANTDELDAINIFTFRSGRDTAYIDYYVTFFVFQRVFTDRVENLNFFPPLGHLPDSYYVKSIDLYTTPYRVHVHRITYVQTVCGMVRGHCEFIQMIVSKRNDRYRMASSCVKIYIQIGTRVPEATTITTLLVRRTIQCKTMSAGQIRGVLVIYAKVQKKKKFNSSSLNSRGMKNQLDRINNITRIFFCKHIYFVHIRVFPCSGAKKNEISCLNKRQFQIEQK